jgi:hypothetical protein
MRKAIQHNLNVAKPSFLSFIKNIHPDMARWIQYVGVEDENGSIIFKFKSSQNSLRFEVYGGVSINNIFELLRGSSNEIYEYFKKLKYDQLSDEN